MILGILNATNTHSELIGQNATAINSYYDMEIWAKEKTPLDAVFLLPPDNKLFGWESFSERASIGKPMNWLHYSILYSRNEVRFEEGARKAKLFGVDIENTKLQKGHENSVIVGNIILNQIYANYRTFSDEDLKRVAGILQATHLITENREISHEGIKLVLKVNDYRIYEIQKS
jgi:hypothetical protein